VAPQQEVIKMVSGRVGSTPAAPVEQLAAWHEGMLEQLEGLDLASRIVTTRPASGEVVRGDRFLDADYLRSAIESAGASLHGRLPVQPKSDEEREVKLAAAASRFTRYYMASLSFAAFVALARGVGLDFAADRCMKVITHGLPGDLLLGDPGDGVVTCAERPAAWPIEGSTVATIGELRAHVWKQLYGEHFAPLIALTRELTRAPTNLLWSNAAEMVAFVADQAVAHLSPSEAAPFVEDTDALLNADGIPGVAGPNPMRGLIEWIPVDEPDFPRGVQLRPHCCITYVLPVRTGLLCGNCPFLPLEDRIALTRERLKGGRGGPAELRSIEIGRKKIRTAD
jgi:Ferric iron reductase FhuF-like transporter